MPISRLNAEDVFHACNPVHLDFQSTAELEPLEQLSEALGQPRAVASLRFGTGMARQGFNIFALGPPGTGRHALVRQVVTNKSKDAPTPDDWCYVNNFDDSARPKMLRLPAGKGSRFARDMENMIREARNALKAAFESEEYQNRVQSVEQELKERQQNAFEEVNEKAKQKGLTIVRTPSGIAFAPLKENGEVMPPDEYQQLPEDQRKKYEQEIERDTLHINTEGRQVGQVNGLSVMMLGDFAFGRPNRINARVHMGKGEVIDIEREAKLSGPLPLFPGSLPVRMPSAGRRHPGTRPAPAGRAYPADAGV